MSLINSAADERQAYQETWQRCTSQENKTIMKQFFNKEQNTGDVLEQRALREVLRI